MLRRANGFYTYFAADIAYHRNKFAVRGFDKVINVWGADHHGHVARLKGAMDALGLDGEHRLDIVLMQLVKLVRDGEVVRMSKRTGKAISLTDLLDEIPVDACRYFFNAKPETQMEFDLGLAVREDSENPVYYVQYAHARICTLLKALEAEGLHRPRRRRGGLLPCCPARRSRPSSRRSPPTARWCAGRPDYDPSHINRYLTELAGDVPPVLYRLPHQGRGEPGAAGPAEAGGYRPVRSEKRHDPHRLPPRRRCGVTEHNKGSLTASFFFVMRVFGPRP